jgi:hypothetical protein
MGVRFAISCPAGRDWDDMPEAVQEQFIEKAKTYVEGRSDT